MLHKIIIIIFSLSLLSIPISAVQHSLTHIDVIGKLEVEAAVNSPDKIEDDLGHQCLECLVLKAFSIFLLFLSFLFYKNITRRFRTGGNNKFNLFIYSVISYQTRAPPCDSRPQLYSEIT